MKRNSRLSAALHGLLHLANRREPMTSGELAACLQTNAVVVRRTMAGLRNAGIVASGRGHGGGWTLEGDLKTIKLRDVYTALGEPMLFQMEAHSESPSCLVEAAINRVLTAALRDAQGVFLERIGNVALADLDVDPQLLHAWQGKSPRFRPRR